MVELKGYYPTRKEIRNKKVRELAKRLKGRSNKETLSNVLEWEGINIEFWQERWPIVPAFLVMLAGLIICLTVYICLPNLRPYLHPVLWLIAIFASSVVATFVIMLLVLYNRRLLNTKSLKNMFKSSISMNVFLEDKLGVCRDYAKLTACLLLNLYPNAEIYFATTPNHVAVGIKVKKRVYMLDQGLPITTIDGWGRPHRIKKIERFTKNSLATVKKENFLLQYTKRKPDIEKLTIRLTKVLNIKKTETKIKPYLIKWKNGALCLSLIHI